MFPDNEFWQCPTYTWSTFLIGLMVSCIISLSFLGGENIGYAVSAGGGIFTFFWMCRTMVHWVNPDERCEAKGFPGHHYMNPSYKPPETEAL